MITDFVRDKSEVRIRLTSLFKAGRLLTFSAFRMGAYSRWALIRGWALIRINTVTYFTSSLRGRRLKGKGKGVLGKGV